MMFLGIALAVIFVSPAFYRLKAKGYGTRGAVLVTVGLTVLLFAVGGSYNANGWVAGLLLPAALFVLSLLLPVRPGAPGTAYLKISFPCPECGETVDFDRDAERRAVLCPACHELIRVPAGEDAPVTPAQDLKSAPVPVNGERDFVTIGKYLLADQAEMGRERLHAAGIPAFLPDGNTGHVHPGLEWAAGGARLMVPVAYEAEARAMLNAPAEDTCLPPDFVPPPAAPEPTHSTWWPRAIGYSLLFLFIFPWILVGLWVQIVPFVFASAVQEGVIASSMSLSAAFRITAAMALTFVAVSFFWESGRNEE